MSDEPDSLKLRAELEAALADRDAMVEELERRTAQMASERRLLEEEQDRFVSRLLVTHERELRRVRAELDEARTLLPRLEDRVSKEQSTVTRLREERDAARVRVERALEQREAMRAELNAAIAGREALQAQLDILRGDLVLARSMLEDVMLVDATPTPMSPARTGEPPAVAVPRESEIRRPGRGRHSAPPSTREREGWRRTDAPRATGTSRDSRPPR